MDFTFQRTRFVNLLLIYFPRLWQRKLHPPCSSTNFLLSLVIYLGLPANGGLRERSHTGQFEIGQCFPDVTLRHAQLDPSLLELLREGLQLP